MVSLKPLSIAILGTRGVPPRYGGFETFAAELSRRLVARGHRVAVYCRDPGPRDWEGVERIVLPAVRHKYFETVSRAALSALDALRRDFDVVLICNAANAFVLPLLRARRIPVAINVDGIERRRRKWNVAGRAVYAIGETFAVSFANRIVADADVIARYYRGQYGAESDVIAYGADFPAEEDSDVLQRLGLRSRDYLLYVSRFEPENNPLEVVKAFLDLSRAERGISGAAAEDVAVGDTHAAAPLIPRSVRNELVEPTLVMVGQGLYAKDLVAELHRHASDRILFPGAIYGRDYRTLQRNALLYIQATEVGGTHPAMIEAMGSGGAVLALGTPENREVGGDAVGYFDLHPETLSSTILETLRDRDRLESFRERGRRRAAQRFQWDAVTDAYEKLFRELTA
jgi:glycosyltransferase involved in cell wall biosynthesis